MQDLHYSFTRDPLRDTLAVLSRCLSKIDSESFVACARSLVEVRDGMETADIYYLFVRCKEIRSLQV